MEQSKITVGSLKGKHLNFWECTVVEHMSRVVPPHETSRPPSEGFNVRSNTNRSLASTTT